MTKRKLFLLVTFALLALCLLPMTAYATETKVDPSMKDTQINAIINAANARDRIIFTEGSYEGKITAAKRDITLFFEEAVDLKSVSFTIGNGQNPCTVWLGSEKPVKFYEIAIKKNASLYSYANAENMKSIVNDGTFTICGGTFTNRAKAEITSNNIMSINDGGTLVNKKGATIQAQSLPNKDGFFKVINGKLTNKGTLNIGNGKKNCWVGAQITAELENSGTITIDGAILENFVSEWKGFKYVGKIINSGKIVNKEGGLYNTSEFTNSGMIENSTEFIDYTGIKNTGTVKSTGKFTDFKSVFLNAAKSFKGYYLRGLLVEVQNKSGATITNATITKSGKKIPRSEVTDIDGKKVYAIKATEEITASASGYKTASVKVDSSQILDPAFTKVIIVLSELPTQSDYGTGTNKEVAF
jgi:hypothetical protein